MSTYLVKKAFDVNNGLFYVNILYSKKSALGILFRFIDKNNHYILEINTGLDNLQLFCMYEGQKERLGNANYNFDIDVWHKFYITYIGDKISVFIQSGTKRNAAPIIAVRNSKLQRGSIALATSGDASTAYFDSVKVD